jgi:hypothetical protein
MSDPVETFVTEAQAFTTRHPDLNATQQSFGGTAWGMLRAVLECPDHAGIFRIPLDREWNRLVCPADNTLWEKPA